MMLLAALLLGAATAPCLRYDGLGARPGEAKALPFGPELIPSAEPSHRVVAFDPGGRELLFTRLGPPGPQIMQSLYRDGKWQAPTLAPFSNIGFNVEPSFSPDGRTLYFVSNRPPSKGTDIWKVERSGDGWSDPVRLGDAVNGDGYDWHPQVTANGDLYFAAEDRKDSLGGADLYVARFVDGAYLPAENLGPQINTAANEWDGYLTPSGDTLIFKSNRPGGYGGLDLYISERRAEAWSTPLNLGPLINTAADEDAGEITPDGRYLTFARSLAGASLWNMMWIDTRAIRAQMGYKSAVRC
jgi:Tol biopolymer transport system component